MRPRLVTDTDVALLRMLARESSVVRASRAVGISRDRANYRLARLAEAFGGPVVASVRGGRGHGGTQLTPLGDRIVREGFDSVELIASRPVDRPSAPNVLRGVYHGGASPEVLAESGIRLRVAFSAGEGETVKFLLDPEAVLVARGRFASSARNVLQGVVEDAPRDAPSGQVMVRIRVGPLTLRASVTGYSVRRLRLVRGARVWIYVKATAFRRVGPTHPSLTRGSPRRSVKRQPPPRGGSANR